MGRRESVPVVFFSVESINTRIHQYSEPATDCRSTTVIHSLGPALAQNRQMSGTYSTEAARKTRESGSPRRQ